MHEHLPEGFVYLDDPRIIYSINYATEDNFMGRKVHGYEAQVCILTEITAKTLQEVQDELDAMEKGYALKIFDAYRPMQAVRDFINWSEEPELPFMRAKYHPYLTKTELFELGYISDHSTHARGSTVDLTIVTRNGDMHKDFDMGTIFDFFGEEAHTESKDVSLEVQNNRKFLCDLMIKYGFENFYQEWWHYTLEGEPFPDTYFDFEIK